MECVRDILSSRRFHSKTSILKSTVETHQENHRGPTESVPAIRINVVLTKIGLLHINNHYATTISKQMVLTILINIYAVICINSVCFSVFLLFCVSHGKRLPI